MNRTLVLFDFDGTISTKDTFPLFIVFTRGRIRAYFAYLLYSPAILLYFLKLYDAENLKKSIMKFHFSGLSKAELQKMSELFIKKLYDEKIVRPEMLAKIREYKRSSIEVCVVSASIDVWLKYFCEKESVSLLCTELKFKDNVFMGELVTKNCNGAEKAIRIKNKYKLSDFDRIIVYGDSVGDREMFDISTESHLITK